ncbi:MAG: diaminopimelate decarboxylase [Actinobacteria bacterium]|jgi:diaminopimelate decarboxylase|nr:diaminopimelate decarboxylase [Actinomycetota bacterium]MCB9427928.1 diaminopimelate decarboxylase [Actinomycetota bacterium]MCO5299260.1 diaminopimelate decarboxylase [Candidatus Nanopelagicales bacterium]HPE12140.1 diaminopimelate decarboxylase [Actinomycetota bacterium]HRV66029.1 diaminopimelate decarboxylase [Candidatus Nanopelagicales bacterium]
MTPPLDLSLYPPHTHIDHEGFLTLAGCRVADLASQFGTPSYLVDAAGLRARAQEFQDALTSRHPHGRVLFASKSFPTPSVMALVAEGGCGLDVAGLGELLAAERAGVDPGNIVLHGNAKSDAEIAKAIEMRLRYIVVDNLDDVVRISRMASEPVPVLLRVSPGIQAETDAKMATGHDASKFGIPSHQVDDAIRRIRSEPLLDLRGLHAHVGSQILNVEQFEQAVAALARLERFDVYDLGGGLGIRYVSSDTAPSVEEYVDRLVGAVHRHLGTDVEVLLEPGRSMVGPNGVTVYRVVTVKRGVRTHVAVDGGMADNLEVALYGQPFEPSIIDKAGRIEVCDVVGRQCESGDTFVTDHALVDPQVGDLLVIPATGAYTFTLSNNYNGALRPPVVFCEDGRAHLAVRRETYEELLGRDQL